MYKDFSPPLVKSPLTHEVSDLFVQFFTALVPKITKQW